MRRDSRGRHSPWLLAVAAWLLLAGCAATPLPSGTGPASGGGPHEGKAEAPGPAATTRAARSFAVVPAQFLPEVGIVVPSQAAAAAAAKGAALGAAQGALTGMQFLVAGPTGVAAAIGTALAFSAIGAMAGAPSGPPDTRVGPAVPLQATPGLREQMVASVITDIGRFTPNGAAIVQGIGPRFCDDSPDYRALAAKGYGDVVEVACRSDLSARAAPIRCSPSSLLPGRAASTPRPASRRHRGASSTSRRGTRGTSGCASRAC
jgi:hypothetical protein